MRSPARKRPTINGCSESFVVSTRPVTSASWSARAWSAWARTRAQPCRTGPKAARAMAAQAVRRAGAIVCSAGARSDVEVGDAERVRLDELAPRLDLVAHQRGEGLARADGILDLDLEQDPLGRIHGG